MRFWLDWLGWVGVNDQHELVDDALGALACASRYRFALNWSVCEVYTEN